MCQQITIEQIDDDELVEMTINAKIDWEYYNDNYEFNPDPDAKTLDRWVVNFIRHNLVNYDEELDKIYGRIGVGTAYEMLKKNILLKIAEVYPKYNHECKRQINEMIIRRSYP